MGECAHCAVSAPQNSCILLVKHMPFNMMLQLTAELSPYLYTFVSFPQAKAEGFLPGGASLHSCMSPHGPDTVTFEVRGG